MFEEFSQKFESGFRVAVTIWISIWLVINSFTYIVRLIAFDTYLQSSGKGAGEWFFNATGSFIGLLLGILILFFLSSMKSSITKNKKTTIQGIFLVSSVVYFIKPTLADLFGTAVFAPDKFISRLPLTVVWLFPSITFLILSVIYYININKWVSRYVDL